MPGEGIYDHANEYLQSLRDVYSGFTVTQTTVPVDDYDRIAGSGVEAGVRVAGDRETIHPAETDDDWADPRVTVGPDETVEAAARRAFREATGVECYVDGLLRVDIVFLLDRENRDREPISRLAVLFRGCRRVEEPTRDRGRRADRRPFAGVPIG